MNATSTDCRCPMCSRQYKSTEREWSCRCECCPGCCVCDPGGARYQVEGVDENGTWSWSNISADGVEANTIFDSEAEAEAAAVDLAGGTAATRAKSE